MNVIVNSLNQLIGRQLSSIEFVQNYVQVRFDGITITALTFPSIMIEGKVYKSEMRDYKNTLYSLIGYTVTNFTFAQEDKLELILLDNIALTMSLRAEDYVAADAIIFTSESKEWWSV
jgi:hypothetical protein